MEEIGLVDTTDYVAESTEPDVESTESTEPDVDYVAESTEPDVESTESDVEVTESTEPKTEEVVEPVTKAAKTKKVKEPKPPKGPSKKDIVGPVIKQGIADGVPRKDILTRLRNEYNLSDACANTYYQNFKSGTWQ